MMGWEFHPATTAFNVFAGDWDRLNALLFGGHPFFDSRFVGSLLKHFSSGKEQLCLCRKDGAICGALILEPAGAGRWKTFKPGQMQATPILVDDAQPLDDLFDVLPGFVWSIDLYAVDPRYSPDLAKLNRPVIRVPQATTIGIQPQLTFNEYWQTRPKKLIANVERYARKAASEFGELRLCKFDGSSEMCDAVKRFGDIESAGWKGKAGTAVSSDNSQGAFYTEVLESFAATGNAAVFELYIGERLASSRLVIGNDRMAIFLKTTYDESLSHIAPGRLQLRAVVEQLRESAPGQTIEFYTNANRDQKEWAGFECTLYNIGLFRSNFIADGYNLLKALRRRLQGPRVRRAESDTTHKVQVCDSACFFADQGYDVQEFAPKDNIELSLDWFDLLHRHVYPNDPGVRYYFTTTADKVVRTIIPVRFNAQGRTRRIDQLGNYYSAIYAPLISGQASHGDIIEVLAQATRDYGGAHLIRFSPMDVDSPTYAHLESALQSTGWIPFRFRCFGNWYLKVAGDWEDYLAKRSPNLRSSIRRRTRKFAADGGTLELITNTEGLEEAIQDFHEVYSASWKKPEPFPDFIPGLIRHLASIGMLRLGIARLGGKPIAAQLWIVGRGKAAICKVAYHETYADYSPGTVLTAFLMQHVIDRDRVTEVDFLIGDDGYKKLWMSDRRERWGLIAYNPRTLLGIYLLLRETGWRCAKKTSKRVHAYLRQFQKSALADKSAPSGQNSIVPYSKGVSGSREKT